jgi:hypothetical protein
MSATSQRRVSFNIDLSSFGVVILPMERHNAQAVLKRGPHQAIRQRSGNASGRGCSETDEGDRWPGRFLASPRIPSPPGGDWVTDPADTSAASFAPLAHLSTGGKGTRTGRRSRLAAARRPIGPLPRLRVA